MSSIISKTEKKILKLFIEEKREMTGYEITKNIYGGNKIKYNLIRSRSQFIYKILKNLVKRGIVLNKRGYPVFYRINPEVKDFIRFSIVYLEVECPHCKRVHWVQELQQTKQCNCIKENGSQRRFWITDTRLTGNKKVI